MPKCFFCGEEFEFPIGVMVVDSVTGNAKFFCSKKCRKNTEQHRKKKKWALFASDAEAAALKASNELKNK